MNHYESNPEAAMKLVPEEQTHTFKFQLIRFCPILFAIGFFGMFFGYVYRDYLTVRDINYRLIQGYSMIIAFVGWIGFVYACRSFGISAKGLSYEKLRAIMRNEVETPFDMELSIRKKIANSMYHFDDQWSLFSSVYKTNPDKAISAVATGPGGVFSMNFVTTDPREKSFVDPAKSLLSGTAALESKLKVQVIPILIFRRHKKYYQNNYEDLRMFTFQELTAFLQNRDTVFSDEELEAVNKTMNELAAIPD